jgi:hypothetical protein
LSVWVTILYGTMSTFALHAYCLEAGW